jgi:hypothetical protein
LLNLQQLKKNQKMKAMKPLLRKVKKRNLISPRFEKFSGIN